MSKNFKYFLAALLTVVDAYLIFKAIENVYNFVWLINKYQDDADYAISTSGTIGYLILIIINTLVAIYVAMLAIKLWRSAREE